MAKKRGKDVYLISKEEKERRFTSWLKKTVLYKNTLGWKKKIDCSDFPLYTCVTKPDTPYD